MSQRLFLTISLILLSVLNSACENKSQKTHITKGKGLSKITQKHRRCLNLKDLSADFLKRSQAKALAFTVFTGDVDFGSLGESGASQGLIFTGKGDAALRAQLALKSKFKPKLLNVNGSALMTTPGISEFLNVVSQADCSEVKFARGNQTETFQVIERAQNELLLQSQSSGDVLHYVLRGEVQLLISRFSREGISICGKALPADGLIKETTGLSWGEGLGKVSLDRGYATTLAAHLKNPPPELSEELARFKSSNLPESADRRLPKSLSGRKALSDANSTPRVAISTRAFDLIRSLVESGQIENLNCN